MMVHIGSLSPSSSYAENYTLQIPRSWKSGTYAIEVSTDANDDVFESTQDGNNIIKKKFEIHQVLPDLTIDNYSIRITRNEESGSIKIQMNVSVKNIGDVDVNSENWYNVIVFYFPSGEKVHVPKVQKNLIIEKDQAYNYTYYLEIQRRQMLTVDISFIVDFYNDVFEKDELNNNQTKTHKLPSMHDTIKLSNFKLFDSTFHLDMSLVKFLQEAKLSFRWFLQIKRTMQH